MKKEEVNKQIKEVVRPNGKGEINGNNLQETLLLMNNNAANDEDTTSKLNLKANQKETDEKLALKADKTSVYTKEEANALLDLKVNIKDYEADKEVSNKEKQELDIKLTQTKQELDSVKNSLSHMGNGVVGEAKGGSIINLPNNAMKSVVPNYKIEGLTVQNLVKNGDFRGGVTGWGIHQATFVDGIYIATGSLNNLYQSLKDYGVPEGDTLYVRASLDGDGDNFGVGDNNVIRGKYKKGDITSYIYQYSQARSAIALYDRSSEYKPIRVGFIKIHNLTQMFGAGNEPSKEWCDANLPDYVEGTKSVQLPMRVKSVGENLFNLKSFGEINSDSNLYKVKPFEIRGVFKPMTKYHIRFNAKRTGGFAGRISVKYTDSTYEYSLWSNADNFTLLSVDSNPNKTIERVAFIHNGESYSNVMVLDSSYISEVNSYKPYQKTLAYFNDELELKSVGTVKDYIENGKLYKNISDDGEILEKTEVVNLSTSGLIEANPNGTVFFEPITNITGFYDNGLDVEGLNILEVEEFSHLINGVYQSLDVSKVKIEGGKLTHPDAQSGIVYLVYRYDDNAVWGENTISYYNSDKTLKSPNGKIWKKVETATDTGELVVTLEEVNIVEPLKEEE